MYVSVDVYPSQPSDEVADVEVKQKQKDYQSVSSRFGEGGWCLANGTHSTQSLAPLIGYQGVKYA